MHFLVVVHILHLTSLFLPVIAKIVASDYSDDGAQHKSEAATH